MLNQLFLTATIISFSFGIFSQQSNAPDMLHGFVENRGQIIDGKGGTNDQVLYLFSRGKGMNVHLRESGFSYDTYRRIDDIQNSTEFLFHRLDFDFLNANEQKSIETTQLNRRKLNYIRDTLSVSTRSYNCVRFNELYTNIDVVFKQNKKGGFKYDFILKPGATLSDIRLKVKGYNELSIEESALMFSLSTGRLTESIPMSWYRSTGEEIDVSYKTIKRGNDEIVLGFSTDEPLAKQELVIIDPEPQLDWGMYLGDSLNSEGNDVITDVDGLIYTTGTTHSVQYIATSGAYQDTLTGNADAYLTKAYTTGFVLWSTYFGGSDNDVGYSLALDSAKNVYLAGETVSSDLLITDSLFQDSLAGNQDLFIAKFTENGNYLWSSYYGSAGFEEQPHIDCDFSGNLYIMASTDSSSLSTSGAYQSNNAGGKDVFISKFDSSLQNLWCTYLGGDENDVGTSIEVSDSLVYLTGNTLSDSLSSSGIHQEVKNDSLDGFIAQFDTLGQFQWFTYFGGEKNDVVSALRVLDDVVAFSGYTFSDSSIVHGSGIFQSQRNGGADAFLGRIDENGLIEWSSYYGGTGDDFGVGISLEYDNNLIMAGNTESIDSISTTDVHQETLNGGFDVFLVKFDTLGGRVWGSYYGGPENDICHAIDVYGNTNIYVTGFTFSDTNIVDTNTAGPMSEYAYNKDAFLTKFNQKKSTQCSGGNCPGGNGSGTQADPYKICAGEEITLTTEGGATGSNSQWVWYEGACGSSGSQVGTGDTIVLTPQTSSVYFVRAESGTDATACVSIFIEVMETPTVDILSNEVFCLNSGYQLQGSADYDYHWVFPNDSVVTDLTTLIAPTTIQDTGWYLLTATANSSGCTIEDSIHLSASDSILYSIDVDSISCYSYNDGAIQITPEDSIYSYSWNALSDTTNSVNELGPGEYVLTVTDTNSCVRSDTVTLFPKNPFILDTISEPTGCRFDDGSIELVLDSLQGPFSISWTHATSEDSSFVDSLGYGSYQAIVTNGEGCIDSVAALVENENGLAIEIVNFEAESCPDQNDGSILIQTVGGEGDLDLIWSHDSTLVDSQAIDLSPGLYEVGVVDSTGCVAKDSVMIEAAPELTWDATIEPADCGVNNGSIIISMNETSLLSTISWNPSNSQSLQLTDANAGNYSITLIDTNNCTYSDTFEITAQNNLEVFATPNYEGINAGDTVLLSATTSNGVSGYTFSWTPDTYMTCANCATTQVNPITSTDYIVTAYHESGCHGSDTAKIVIESNCVDIFIPDHFSPNGDALNDEWCVIGSCIASAKIQVYNRWGQKVFDSDNAQSCWDGTFKGEPIPNGNYVYDIHINLISGETIDQKGKVNVVR